MINKKSIRNKTSMSKAAAALLVFALQAFFMTACGSADMTESSTAYDVATADYDNGAGYYSYEEADYDDVAEEENVDADSAQTVSSDRKLIKTVDVSLETENYDSLLSDLESQVTALGGYIESRYSNNRNNSYQESSRNLRYTSMTVRMPKDKLDTFLASVSEQTNVVSISENVEDVTLQYVDMESHKKALLTEQERLLELLGKAETVEDIISIEDRLSEVRYQIESMESQLRTYDNKIDYSTVYLSIDEVEQYSPSEGETVGERIRNGFLDSLEGVKDGLAEFAIWFVIKLPYLVVWAVIIAVIVFIILKIRRHIRKKHAQKAAAPGPVNPYAQQENPGIQQPVPEHGTDRADTKDN
jgi:hypothetical protein